jgi:hypothetical protein
MKREQIATMKKVTDSGDYDGMIIIVTIQDLLARFSSI